MLRIEFSKEQTDRIIADRLEGYSIAKLCQKYHVSKGVIQRTLKENRVNDIGKPNYSFAKEHADLVIKDFEAGAYIKDLAIKYKASRNTIANICKGHKRGNIEKRDDERFSKSIGYIYGNSKRLDTGKLLALHNAGWSAEKIADEMQTQPRTVRKCLEKLRMK